MPLHLLLHPEACLALVNLHLLLHPEACSAAANLHLLLHPHLLLVACSVVPLRPLQLLRPRRQWA
jgi:hypothetical protein